ncbi:hypothetical protein L211DRAFT_891969 [Terfezia boudieri ATCC MYA-4762]|uniref:Uncharacterized protein n=1 Tax=Terfezia boudieri ATCC MYA-4762 TaxID=1051890 RepID=A0A3N4M420_9PEZI|nr:hypothetical protein L211DRAFT_891969 [Terfezia boudieri ATCC MYA-4762]
MTSHQTPKKRRRGRPRRQKEQVIYDTITVRAVAKSSTGTAQPELATPPSVSGINQNALSTSIETQPAPHRPQVLTAQEDRRTAPTVADDLQASGTTAPSGKASRLGRFPAPCGPASPTALSALHEADGPQHDVPSLGQFTQLAEAPKKPVLEEDFQTGVDVISSSNYMHMSPWVAGGSGVIWLRSGLPLIVVPAMGASGMSLDSLAINGTSIFFLCANVHSVTSMPFSTTAAPEPTTPGLEVEVYTSFAHALPQARHSAFPTCTFGHYPLSPFIKQEFEDEVKLIDSEQEDPMGMDFYEISAMLDESLEKFPDNKGDI